MLKRTLKIHYLVPNPESFGRITRCPTGHVPIQRTSANTADVTCRLCLFFLGLYKPPHMESAKM